MRRYGGIFLIALIVPLSAGAQVIISEIMYDLESGSDTGREWVEVFNVGSSAVTLTDWKFFEADTNHSVTAFSGGEALASGAYAVIADNPTKFLADWPGFSGLLFDSAFSLGNTGETVAVRTPELATSDSVAYQSAWGGAGDGTALQRNSADTGAFAPGAPTPGSGALVASAGPASDSGSNSSSQTGSSQTSSSSSGGTPVPSYVPALEPELFAYAGTDRDAIAGADVLFEGLAYDKEGNPIDPSLVRFLWTFGDGASANGQKVFHRFSEPSRYAVVLDLARSTNSASARVVVNVHPVSVTLSLRNNAVVLANTSGRELDLSGWHLRAGPRTFTLPQHSIILVGASVPFTREVTGLGTYADTALLYPNGAVAATVTASAETPAVSPASSVAPAPAPRVSASPPAPEEVVVAEPEEVASPSALVASVGQSAPPRAYWWWLGALALGGAAGGMVVLSRRSARKEWNIIEEK
jgi:hypothetical protein